MTTRCDIRYEHILVPLDGSLLSEYVLPHVQTIASFSMSQITLLHVIPGEDDVPVGLTPSQKANRADIVNYLDRVGESLRSRNLIVDWSIRTGEAAQEIILYVEEHDVDLILMSTHGQGESYGKKMGSVAAEVLDEVLAPILMTRVPETVAKL